MLIVVLHVAPEVRFHVDSELRRAASKQRMALKRIAASSAEQIEM